MLRTLAPQLPLEILQATVPSHRARVSSALTNPLINIVQHARKQAIKAWQDPMLISGHRPRPELLNDLQALMSYTLAIVQAEKIAPPLPTPVSSLANTLSY